MGRELEGSVDRWREKERKGKERQERRHEICCVGPFIEGGCMKTRIKSLVAEGQILSYVLLQTPF